MRVNSAYKYRFYPTEEQAQILAKTFGCARFLYNHYLDLTTKAYAADKKAKFNYNALSADLTQLKKKEEYRWLQEVSSVPLQQSLQNLKTGYTNFFKKRAKYPNFKKRTSKQSAKYTNTGFNWDGARSLKLAKMSGDHDDIIKVRIEMEAALNEGEISYEEYVTIMLEVKP